jgi:hypothetical protein
MKTLYYGDKNNLNKINKIKLIKDFPVVICKSYIEIREEEIKCHNQRYSPTLINENYENYDYFDEIEDINYDNYEEVIINCTLSNENFNNIIFKNVTHLNIMHNINVQNISLYFPNVTHIKDNNGHINYDELLGFKNKLISYYIFNVPNEMNDKDLSYLYNLRHLIAYSKNAFFNIEKCDNLEYVDFLHNDALKKYITYSSDDIYQYIFKKKNILEKLYFGKIRRIYMMEKMGTNINKFNIYISMCSHKFANTKHNCGYLSIPYEKMETLLKNDQKRLFINENGKKKISTAKCLSLERLYEYTNEKIDLERDGHHYNADITVESMHKISDYINKYKKKIAQLNNLKRGDLIKINDRTYRNNDTFIWNGDSIENFNFDIDEYGSIPDDYNVISEFPCSYWKRFRTHNNLVPFDFNKILNTNIKKLILESKKYMIKNTYNNMYDGLSFLLFIDIETLINMKKYKTKILFEIQNRSDIKFMKNEIINHCINGNYTAYDTFFEYKYIEKYIKNAGDETADYLYIEINN